jgi:hypothetical protein
MIYKIKDKIKDKIKEIQKIRKTKKQIKEKQDYYRRYF